MKQKFRRAYDALQRMGVPVYERPDMDGRFHINAEAEDSYKWADYWSSGKTAWEFGVNPRVENTLRRHGLYSEWVNPGELGVYEL